MLREAAKLLILGVDEVLTTDRLDRCLANRECTKKPTPTNPPPAWSSSNSCAEPILHHHDKNRRL